MYKLLLVTVLAMFQLSSSIQCTIPENILIHSSDHLEIDECVRILSIKETGGVDAFLLLTDSIDKTLEITYEGEITPP